MYNSLLERITVDQQICHGKPTVRGMRYPVDMILDLLSSGMTHQEILTDYPVLEEKDILACWHLHPGLRRVKSYSQNFGMKFLIG